MKKKSNLLVVLSFSLFIFAILVFFVFMMQGTTTTSGGYPENTKNSSILCNNDGLSYPFFRYDESIEKNTEITALFNDGSLKSISLRHTLSYNSESLVTTSEAQNHAAMNISFGNNRLEADAFSARYSKSDNKMIMNLYASQSDLKAANGNRYFLLDRLSIDSSIDQYKDYYEKQGFVCKINE